MRLLRLAAIAIYLSSAVLAARFGAEHVGKIIRLNDPQISPDGKSIALVVSRANFECNRYDAELVIIDLASHTQCEHGHFHFAPTAIPFLLDPETSKPLPPAVLDEAFSRIQVTYDPLHGALTTAAQQAFDAGFLGRQMPDLSKEPWASIVDTCDSR